MTVGGIKATGQYLAAVTKESTGFSGDVIDGLLGLAFPSISNLGQVSINASRFLSGLLASISISPFIPQNPFFNTAFKQGTAKTNMFGFKLASSGSELYIGGSDSSLYSGSLEYHKLTSSSGFWQIGGATATVGGSTAVSGFQTIIDSGTTIMYAPSSAAKSFYAKVPGSKLFDSTNGFYSFPCSSVPSVSFSWGGKAWAISADK